jgi:hypothetical protein
MAKFNFIDKDGQPREQVFTFEEVARQPDEAIKTSLLGTPIMDTLRFEQGSYVDQAGERRTWPQVDLDTAIITVSQRKNIVITPVQGYAGTVKQYISPGDFELSVQAAIISPYSRVFPADELAQLRAVLEAPVALEVSSRFLAIWGITNIVVTSFQLNQIEGYANQIILSLAGLSDRPVELLFTPDAP